MSQAPEPDQARVATGERLADVARTTVLRYFQGDIGEEDKPDATPVTLADRASEQAMRDVISSECPADGVVGEEFGTSRPDAEYVWVLDPIDGTKQFVTGKPTFGCLIALLHAGRPILGIVEIPVLGERWIGRSDGKTVRYGREGAHVVHARTCSGLDGATLCTTGPDNFETALGRRGYENLRGASRITVYGGDCHNYALLASGFCDLVIDGGMSTYDYAALIPVIEGAGGVVTDFQGNPLTQGDADVIAAADASLHAAALKAIHA